MPNGRDLPGKYTDSPKDEDRMLEFKPGDISQLTKNIEIKLRSVSKRKASGKPQKKRDAKDGAVNLRNVASKQRPSSNEGSQNARAGRQESRLPADKLGSFTPEQRGKKRSQDGQVKAVVPTSNSAGSQINGRVKGILDRSLIEQEVLALGGTKEDYELVENDDSTTEIEFGDSERKNNKGLKKDLVHFVKELGIDQVGQGPDQSSEGFEGDRTNDVSNGLMNTLKLKNEKKRVSHLYFEPLSEWYSAELPAIPSSSSAANAATLPPGLLEQVHEYATLLLDSENKEYQVQNGSKNSAQQFYSTIMSSGTLSDKISALTLSVQESPVHNMKALENLVSLAGKRSRSQAVEVLGALKDLFGTGSLLPSNRKLLFFEQQPGVFSAFQGARSHWKAADPLPKPLSKAHLIAWAYEHWLKTIYFEVLKTLEVWCNDEVVFARGRAVEYVCQLLREKPEQEKNLLRLLVDKLGDTEKKVASKTSYNILQLETTHPLMKPIIISAIENDLLFRPNQSLHAQYYAVITLNQTVLSGKEEGVARKLLDIYFSLFSILLAKPKVMDATSTATAAAKNFNKKGELQGGGGVAGKAAKRKTALKEKKNFVDVDLREKMLSAVLTGVNRAVPFTSTTDEAFKTYLDTLFRVTHSSNFNTSVQALMLIQQLSGIYQGSVDRFYRSLYESLLDPRLLTSSKQTLYLNLLFRALRSDLNAKRVKAFSKRLLQIVSMHQPAFTCGALYLLRELEGNFASLRNFIDDPEEDGNGEEERFHDIADEELDIFEDRPKPESLRKPYQSYDSRKRDPEHSNAEKSSLWELLPFLHHYHPSVSLFAAKLLTHSAMPPKPDLSSHSLIQFLDRFVYRNPKATPAARGFSIMQPLAGGDSSGILLNSLGPKSRSKDPVNSEAFWKMESEKVDPDEVFFHKYFSSLGKEKERAKERKRKRAGKAEAGDGEDEYEEEIWKALVESRPEIEGSGEDEGEEDMDMEDLESEMGSTEDKVGGEDVEAIVNGEGMVEPGDESEAEEMDKSDDEPMNLEEDDEALLESDEELPSDLEKTFEREVKESEAAAGSSGARKRREKRRLRNLPTFASAEDYAEMIGDDEAE
ncbi:MAG: hypothetical protein Q9214_002238 [Letrouitia sp. 1 TL-2023]